jgi:hypothetical protein
MLHVAPALEEGEAEGEVDGDEEGEEDGDEDADGEDDALALVVAVGVAVAVGLPELLLPEITYVTSERAGMVALNAPPLTAIAGCVAALFEPLVSTGVAVPPVIPTFDSPYDTESALLAVLSTTTATVPSVFLYAERFRPLSEVVAAILVAPGWMYRL